MTGWEAPAARDSFVAILVGDRTDAVTEALALAGGRLRETIAWDAIERAMVDQVGRPVVMLELAGADDALLEAMLPTLASVLTRLDLRAVATLTTAQIDRVAATLLGGHVQLLCGPSVSERVIALAIAAQYSQGAVLHDRVNEGEEARLARLNAEVARIAEVLARLSRREDAASRRADLAARQPSYEVPISREVVPEPIDAAAIRQTIRARRLRAKQFGDGLFEDPAWDIILDLYAAHLERAQVSVSSLCIAAAVAPTTALRWIAKMSDAGLLQREPDPFDKRRAFMALSPRALDGMRAYVAALQEQGLPIV